MLVAVLRILNVKSIPDPGSNNNNKRGGVNFVVLPFFVALFCKQFYFLKVWTIFIVLFTQKFVIKLSKIWV
jgi:hypothetical protein